MAPANQPHGTSLRRAASGAQVERRFAPARRTLRPRRVATRVAAVAETALADERPGLGQREHRRPRRSRGRGALGGGEPCASEEANAMYGQRTIRRNQATPNARGPVGAALVGRDRGLVRGGRDRSRTYVDSCEGRLCRTNRRVDPKDRIVEQYRMVGELVMPHFRPRPAVQAAAQ